MKKMLSSIPLILLFLLLVFGGLAIIQYFSYVGPQLARQAAVEADLKQLELEKERMLLLNRAVEERLRSETTTNAYYYGILIGLAATVGFVGFYIWKGYDSRKESWARAVDGMFALQTKQAEGVTWTIDPNKTFTSAIGVADSGEIAELPVPDKVGADRQLTYNKAVQTTRSAVAVSAGGDGFKYAATGKFLAGAYDKAQKMLSTTDGQNYEEVDNEPIPVISLNEAWESSSQSKWIIGQSELDGEQCVVNIKQSVHLAIIGAPGVGKTESTGLLVASYAVADGMIVICLDGKGGSDWTNYSDFFEVQETNEHVFPSQWKSIAQEHNRRLALLRENNWKTIDDSKGAVPHVLIILEEFGALLQNIQMSNKELHKKIVTSVTNLMKLSRSTGIHFCIIDQTLADCPNEIKGIVKLFIAYKLNGGIGNSVKLYYLDKLADNGEFCSSNSPNNKFKAWHTSTEFKLLPLDKRTWNLLPELPEQQVAGVLTDFETDKREEPKQLTQSQDEKIVQVFMETGSLNKTTEAVFGKGKKGKYYTDKVKPVLIAAGVYNEPTT